MDITIYMNNERKNASIDTLLRKPSACAAFLKALDHMQLITTTTTTTI